MEAFWLKQSKDDNEFEKFEELAAKGEGGERGADDDEQGDDEPEEEESDEGDEGDDYIVVSGACTNHMWCSCSGFIFLAIRLSIEQNSCEGFLVCARKENE